VGNLDLQEMLNKIMAENLLPEQIINRIRVFQDLLDRERQSRIQLLLGIEHIDQVIAKYKSRIEKLELRLGKLR